MYEITTISSHPTDGLAGPGSRRPPFGRSASVVAFVVSLVFLLAGGTLPPSGIRVVAAATPPPFRAPHAAVASDNPLASAAGVSALKAGGNAVDAACATALALGVVHPDSSGMGGGGFAVVYIAKEKKVYALDFRERAPAAASAALFIKD